MMTDEERIARYIELNPNRPGLDEARIVDYGIAVWALIGYLRAAGGDAARVAADYAVPPEVVEAAQAYYRRHPALIDARIDANRAEISDLLPAA